MLFWIFFNDLKICLYFIHDKNPFFFFVFLPYLINVSLLLKPKKNIESTISKLKKNKINIIHFLNTLMVFFIMLLMTIDDKVKKKKKLHFDFVTVLYYYYYNYNYYQ